MTENFDDEIFVIKFREFLEDANISAAAKLFDEAESAGIVSRCVFELIPILSSNLTESEKSRNSEIFEIRKKLLQRIAEKCNAKETILIIVEQIKNVEDEESFGCLLRPLRECLVRSNLDKTIDWCTDSIKSYQKGLPKPENENPESQENADIVKNRLIRELTLILWFLEPVTTMASKSNEAKTRNHILSTYLHLFGSPFCHLDPKNTEQQIFESLLAQMSQLTGNFLNFHKIIHNRSLNRKQEQLCESDDEDFERKAELELFRSQISNLAYANYYYYVMISEEGKKNTPEIYNPHYLMQGCFYLSLCLLKRPEYILVTKGLAISEAVIEKIERYSIGHELLEFAVHNDLCVSLAQVMIYCDADGARKKALKVFRSYIERFSIRGRYLLLLSLYETANHSGFLALLTNIAKESITHCLNNNPKCEHFLGSKLERLMKRICRLPNGSASDLVEISDEIIAALNLVRFLTIRDTDDSSGIWSIIESLEKEYLKPLREGIDLARAHWKVKVRDLEKESKNIDGIDKTSGRQQSESIESKIEVSVGGQNLPMMPAAEKIKFCHQAINALDIIESIVIRVNECIENNPRKNH